MCFTDCIIFNIIDQVIDAIKFYFSYFIFMIKLVAVNSGYTYLLSYQSVVLSLLLELIISINSLSDSLLDSLSDSLSDSSVNSLANF